MDDKKLKNEMIHLLALETSGLTSGVYLSAGDQLLGQITLNQKNIHSRKLAESVDQLLSLSEVDKKDLSGIVLSAGPGSFTGLRIGYSLGKGLAHALKIPLVEIPTLDIWAYQNGKTALPVFSFVDAHRDELFYAIYHWTDQAIDRKTEYGLCAFEDISKVIQSKTVITGAKLIEYQDRFISFLGEDAVFSTPLPGFPEGWALLSLGFKKYTEEKFSPPESCEPLYLRAFKGIM
jgi:tRNA threonylcarbamoyladenosine biosynthesis protein TsaB